MTYADAKVRLTSMVQAAVEPTLSSDELDELLTLAQRPDVFGNFPYTPWRASANYAVGDYVVPKPRNGHLYRASIAGTSASSEPTWPTSAGGTVVDGGTGGVTWEESGSAPWLPTYDLNAGAAEGWRWKAGKQVPVFDINVERQVAFRDQIYQHCLEQAERYAKKISTAVSIADWGRPPAEPLWWW